MGQKFTSNREQNEQYSIVNDCMKPKDAIKLDTVPLDKTCPKETVIPEDCLYRYLYHPSEQHGDQKRQTNDLIWSKNT